HDRTARADFAEALQCRTQGHGTEDDDDHAPGRASKGSSRPDFFGRNPQGFLRRFARMTTFRYQAIAGHGGPAGGVIVAEDRKSALQLLGQQGLFPSSLEISAAGMATTEQSIPSATGAGVPALGKRITRKDITAFTREMSALLGAAIPIPQAL